MTRTNDSGLPAVTPIRPSRTTTEPATVAACRADYAAAAPVRAELDKQIRRTHHIPTAPAAEQPLTAAQLDALLANYTDEEGN